MILLQATGPYEEAGNTGDSDSPSRGVLFTARQRATTVPHGRGVEIPIEIAGSNPSVNCVPADPELPSERTLARALLQVVPE